MTRGLESPLPKHNIVHACRLVLITGARSYSMWERPNGALVPLAESSGRCRNLHMAWTADSAFVSFEVSIQDRSFFPPNGPPQVLCGRTGQLLLQWDSPCPGSYCGDNFVWHPSNRGIMRCSRMAGSDYLHSVCLFRLVLPES